MKSAIIFGEFIEKSTTGIAYMNSVLEESLIEIGFQINKFYDPRTGDHKSKTLEYEKNFNLVSYIKLFRDIYRVKKSNIAFFTLSFHKKLGMFKILIISFFLRIKSDQVYVFVHRGDLFKEYKSSIFKRLIINFIFSISNKIIFLSSKIKSEMSLINQSYKKFGVLSNCLTKNDINKSNSLFKKFKYSPIKNSYNCIFSSNIQKSKGVFEIVESINNLNKVDKKIIFLIYMDIYSIR